RSSDVTLYLRETKVLSMFPFNHDERPATIYVSEDSVYAVYDDNDEGDVFFHVDLDDDSVDLSADLTNAFGAEIAVDILTEIGVI
ncbi:MAG: hypothetical protein ACK5SP_00385, partial [bacterium]